MKKCSRRGFLQGLAAASSLVALPGLAQEQVKSNAANQPADTVRFTIAFNGPLAFVWKAGLKGDTVTVYGAHTRYKHFPVVSSDYAERPLGDGVYRLDFKGCQGHTKVSQGPVCFDATDAGEYASQRCRFAVTVPRPDVVKGLLPTRVEVKGETGDRPTGLRFIYEAFPKNSIPMLLKGSTNYFDAKFQADDPVWNLNIQLNPKNPLDRCHKESKSSFRDVLKLCGIPPVRLKYLDDASCRSHLLNGGGSDCQVISVGINT